MQFIWLKYIDVYPGTFNSIVSTQELQMHGLISENLNAPIDSIYYSELIKTKQSRNGSVNVFRSAWICVQECESERKRQAAMKGANEFKWI